ncbi:MAG TPA: ABC transporter permease [Acidobacteriota bacterium]|nr:ABC transporter permease [Acidobacteriota bacterium]
MNTILQDLRYALRVHFKNPQLAIVIITTLGLGIGCLTAIFTVVNSVILQPLSYPDPQRLIRVYESFPSQGIPTFSVSPLNWLDWRRNKSFEDLGAFARQQDFNFSIGNTQQQVSANRVSSNLFQVLGVKPLKGSLFTSEYDQAGRELVAILSFNLWSSKFGKDEQIIGKKIFLDQKAYRILAVMPSSFRLPFNNGDLYLPLALDSKEMTDRSDHFLRVIGRLKPGVTFEQALQEMKNTAAALAAQYPNSNKDWTVAMRTLQNVVVPDRFRSAAWILLASAFLVLTISCLNAANLLTVKTLGRYREISIRRAIGATTSRLLSQLLTESFLIAIISGVLGILLAVWGIQLLQSLEPENIPRLDEIRVDPVVMIFAISASFLTVILFGSLTAHQSMKQDLQEGLKEGTLSSTTGGSRRRFRNFLVIVEAALSLVLLICAALLIKSFLHLQNVDLGFNPDSVLTVKVTTPVDKFSDKDNSFNVQNSVLEKIKQIPGIEHAAIASLVPMGQGNSMTDFSTEGQPSTVDSKKVHAASFRVVSAEYFKTMNIRLSKGQYFDSVHPAKTALIDEFLMRQFWPNQEPIGSRIFVAGFEGPFEIIGVVHHVKSMQIDEEPFPILYLPIEEVRSESSIYMIARTLGKPERFVQSIRKQISQVDPNLVIGITNPLSHFVRDSLSQRRFNMVILGVFAVVALILASVGIYSVISYSVSQRSHEIGIRMALGARQHDVAKMIIKEGLLLAVVGIGAGVVLSFVSTRMLSALLYFVSPTDAIIFQVCSLFFLTIALLSSYLPARRASKVDPIVALRHE